MKKKYIKVKKNAFKKLRFKLNFPYIPVCEDYLTGKKYKHHKWEYEDCECPHCFEGHKICIRCAEREN